MEKLPTPLSLDQIHARIAEIDQEIMQRTGTGHLASISGKNELGSSLEESGLEEERNDADYAQEAAVIRNLQEERSSLQERLEALSKTS